MYDEHHVRRHASEPAVAAPEGSGIGGKSIRPHLGGSPSKRQVDRKDNQSFFDKSRSAKGFSGKGAKSQRRVAAFTSRTPNRMKDSHSPGEESKKRPVSPGGKSRFARSIMAVTDAMFGPPPEWILRQTTPIKR